MRHLNYSRRKQRKKKKKKEAFRFQKAAGSRTLGRGYTVAFPGVVEVSTWGWDAMDQLILSRNEMLSAARREACKVPAEV
ncbi:hypothetical protein OFB61_24840, partial [Escherichia coli]|nr:hypothetical protein [Escherichia coli]